MVAELVSENWNVHADGSLYRRAGNFEIAVSSGIDWFELRGSADFGGVSAPLPRLLTALRKNEQFVPLDDGSFGVLPEQWLRKFGLLASVANARRTTFGSGRHKSACSMSCWPSSPKAIRRGVRAARGGTAPVPGHCAVDPPAGFHGQLRDYQRDGLGWLHFLREFGFGGCLADDMGLGKTVQVLALLERAVLRPPDGDAGLSRRWSSCRGRWSSTGSRRQRVSPRSFACSTTPGTAAARPPEQFEDYDVILTTYGTLRNDIASLKEFPFDYAILDEAQAIKNAADQSAKAARLIEAEHRLALSGTPVENHLGELWSLFEFLNPGMLGQAAAFGKATPACRQPPTRRRGSCWPGAAAVHPPPHQGAGGQRTAREDRADVYCDLEGPQRKLYDELREHYRQALLGSRRCATGIRSRRSRSSKRCCDCARPRAIPA